MIFSTKYYKFILKLLTRANEIVEEKSRFVNQNGERDTIVFDVISHLLCHELNKEAKKSLPKKIFNKIEQLYKNQRGKKVLDLEKATELYALIFDNNAWEKIPEDTALLIYNQAEQLLKKKFSLIAQTRNVHYYVLLETIFAKSQTQQNTFAKRRRDIEYFSNDGSRLKFKSISYNPETGQSSTIVPFPQGDFRFIDLALLQLKPSLPTQTTNEESVLSEDVSFLDNLLSNYQDRADSEETSITTKAYSGKMRLTDSFYSEVDNIKKLLGVVDKKYDIKLEEFLALFALYGKEVIQGIPHQNHSQYQPSRFYHITDDRSATDFHHALSVNGTIYSIYLMLFSKKKINTHSIRVKARYELLQSNNGEGPYETVKTSDCRISNLLTALHEKADLLNEIAEEYKSNIKQIIRSDEIFDKLEATTKATILANLFLLDEAHYKNKNGDLVNQSFIQSLKYLPDCLYHTNPYQDTPYYSLQDLEAFFDKHFKLNISVSDIPNKLYSIEELEKQDLAEQRQADALATEQGTKPEKIKKRVVTIETKDGKIKLPASPTKDVSALEYREDRKTLFFNALFAKKNFLANVIEYWKEKNLSPAEIRELLKQNPVDLSGVSNKNNYRNKIIHFLGELNIPALQPTKSELDDFKKNPLSKKQWDKLHTTLSKIFKTFAERYDVSRFYMADLMIEYVKAGYISYEFFSNLLNVENVEFENFDDLFLIDFHLTNQYTDFIESFYQSFSKNYKELISQLRKANNFQENLKGALINYRKEKKERDASDAETNASDNSDSPQNSVETSVGDQVSSSEFEIAEKPLLSPLKEQRRRYKKYLRTFRKKARAKSKNTQQKQLPITEKTNAAQNQQLGKGKTKTVVRSNSAQNNQLAKIVTLHKEPVHLKATGTDGASYPTSTTSQNSFANKQNHNSQTPDNAKIIDFKKQKKILSSQQNLSKNTVAHLKSTPYWKVPLTVAETKYLRGLNAVGMAELVYETSRDLKILYDYANGVASDAQAMQASIHLSVKATLVTFMRYLMKASPRLALNVSGVGTAAWALESAMNNKKHIARFFKIISKGVQLEFKEIFEGRKIKYLPNKQFDYEKYLKTHELYEQDPSHRDELIKQTLGFYDSCNLPIRMAFDYGNETFLSNINFSSEVTYYLKQEPKEDITKDIPENPNDLLAEIKQDLAQTKKEFPLHVTSPMAAPTEGVMNKTGEVEEYIVPELVIPPRKKEEFFYPEFGLNMVPLSFVYKLGYKQRFKSISIDGKTYSPLYNHTNGMLLTLEKQNRHELTSKYNLKINLKQNKVTVCEGKSLVGFLALDKDKVIITESIGYKPLTAKEYLAHCQKQYKATNKTLNLTIDMKTINEMQAKPDLTFEQWKQYENIICKKLLDSMKPHQQSKSLENLLNKINE